MPRAIFLLLLLLSFGCSPIRDVGYRNVSKITLEGNVSRSFHVMVDQEGTKVRAKRNYYWFHKDSIHHNEGDYSGRLLDGQYQEFDAEGHMILSGNFKKGLKHGRWTGWHAHGLKKTVQRYCNGFLRGNSYHYDDEGRLIVKEKYVWNKLSGVQTTYDHDRDEVHKVVYRKGERLEPRSKTDAGLEENAWTKIRAIFSKKDKEE